MSDRPGFRIQISCLPSATVQYSANDSAVLILHFVFKLHSVKNENEKMV